MLFDILTKCIRLQMHAKMSNDNFTGHNFFYLVYTYLVDRSASKTNDIHFICVTLRLDVQYTSAQCTCRARDYEDFC